MSKRTIYEERYGEYCRVKLQPSGYYLVEVCPPWDGEWRDTGPRNIHGRLRYEEAALRAGYIGRCLSELVRVGKGEHPRGVAAQEAVAA